MIKLIQFSILVAITALVSGCASTVDIQALDVKVRTLEDKLPAIIADANSAKAISKEAVSTSAKAEAAASRAIQYATEFNLELDKIFCRPEPNSFHSCNFGLYYEKAKMILLARYQGAKKKPSRNLK